MSVPYHQLAPGAGLIQSPAASQKATQSKKSSIRCTRIVGCCFGVLCLVAVIAIEVSAPFWKSTADLNIEIGHISLADVSLETYVTSSITYFDGMSEQVAGVNIPSDPVSASGSFEDIENALTNGNTNVAGPTHSSLSSWASAGGLAATLGGIAAAGLILAGLMVPCASSLANSCGCPRAREVGFQGYIPSVLLLLAAGALAVAIVTLNSSSMQDMDQPSATLATCAAIVFASYKELAEGSTILPMAQLMSLVCDAAAQFSGITVTATTPAMGYFGGALAGIIITIILCTMADCNASSLRHELVAGAEQEKLLALYAHQTGGSLNVGIQMHEQPQCSGAAGQLAYQPPSVTAQTTAIIPSKR